MENIDQSADFFYRNVRVGWKVKIVQIHKKSLIFFCTRKHALNAPFFGK